jgi:hypothetical protein
MEPYTLAAEERVDKLQALLDESRETASSARALERDSSEGIV